MPLESLQSLTAETSLQFKVILLGDSGVGKSSIAKRLSQDWFTTKYTPTIGLDLYQRQINLYEDFSIMLNLWDVSGSSLESYYTSKTYLRDADMILLTYDTTNYGSFRHTEDWYRMIKNFYKNTKTDFEPGDSLGMFGMLPENMGNRVKRTLPYIAVLANKADLSHLRAVKMDAHSNFLAENGLHGFMVSAKTGNSVITAVSGMVADLIGTSNSKDQFYRKQQLQKSPGLQSPPYGNITPIEISKNCIVQ
ncbi:P-loop containing nucleoside triphosphate hydrolase protein [Paraphysoderma sedebokerense]|nr:P-loop containing nucleoside triphosphate hydrolase protein [Paraphysoderma sedebokerense]